MAETTSTHRAFGHWINGEARASESAISRIDPSTGDLFATYAEGTEADIADAVAHARRTFDSGAWSGKSSFERARVLNKWAALIEEHLDELADIEVAEAGKTIRVARGDIEGSIDLTQYAASLCMQEHGESYTNFGTPLSALVVREPIGVVGAIIPWNFPTIIFAQKVPFALASGCSVVVKPSEFTSGTAVLLAELATRAGLPDGVLNVVTGYGAPVGQYLVESPDVDMISFTGSTPTGRRIVAGQAANFKRLGLELGGKSAAIVCDDANIDAAVEGVMYSIFMHQGQLCCGGSRLLVEDGVADEFLARLSARASTLKMGDPRDEATDLGPMVSPQQFEIVSEYLGTATSEGAKILCGGVAEGASADPGKLWIGATVLDGVEPSHRVYREEIFGPVLTVTRFSGIEEAIALANDSEYGLAGSVWTEDFHKGFEVARRVRAGSMEINTSLEGQPQLPFGGYKMSGIGREKGRAGYEEFTELKSIGFRSAPRDDFFAPRA